MQPGTPEEWAELRRSIGAVVANLEAMKGALMRHTTATTFALVFLMQEMEARGGLDRAALAEMTIACPRLGNLTAHVEMERAVSPPLFGTDRGALSTGSSRGTLANH